MHTSRPKNMHESLCWWLADSWKKYVMAWRGCEHWYETITIACLALWNMPTWC